MVHRKICAGGDIHTVPLLPVSLMTDGGDIQCQL
jgi:hypothetical protein